MKTKYHTKTYGNLFTYLCHRRFDNGIECDGTLRLTQEFAEKHGLFFEHLAQVLGDMGGYCDCEVLLNAEPRIAADQVIGQETFMTPRQVAIERGLYCRYANDDELLSCQKAGTGCYVPCAEDDPGAMLDLNRAAVSLCESGCADGSKGRGVPMEAVERGRAG